MTKKEKEIRKIREMVSNAFKYGWGQELLIENIYRYAKENKNKFIRDFKKWWDEEYKRYFGKEVLLGSVYKEVIDKIKELK